MRRGALALLCACAAAPGLRAQDAPPVGPATETETVRWGLHEWLDERLPGQVRLGGVLALDALLYDDRNDRDSGLWLDRATLIVDGTLDESWSWRVAPDLVGIDTRYGLEEAWIAWRAERRLRARVGLQRVPLGTEQDVREEHRAFVGWSAGPYLDGLTDVAALVEAEHGAGLLSWQLSATAGAGFSELGQDRETRQLAARLVTYPFRSAGGLLGGLFTGAAYARASSWEGQIDVAHPLRTKLFDTPELDATGGARWWHVSSGWDAGSVRLLHEVQTGSLLDVEAPGGGEVDLEDQITAWSGSLAWMVTGERYDSRLFRAEPRAEPFPAEPWGEGDGWGALELAARYANGDVDRDFYAFGFTDYSQSSQEFRTFSFAVNWYATRSFRLTAQIVRTLADDDVEDLGGGGRDTSFVLRGQWSF